MPYCSTIDVKQLQRESDGWKRTLELLLLENAYLKNKLAEIVNVSSTTLPFLEKAEDYQNRFMQKDEVINLMRQDIHEFDRLLAACGPDNKTMLKSVQQKQQMLRKELLLLESTFSQLKVQFRDML